MGACILLGAQHANDSKDEQPPRGRSESEGESVSEREREGEKRN